MTSGVAFLTLRALADLPTDGVGNLADLAIHDGAIAGYGTVFANCFIDGSINDILLPIPDGLANRAVAGLTLYLVLRVAARLSTCLNRTTVVTTASTVATGLGLGRPPS